MKRTYWIILVIVVAGLSVGAYFLFGKKSDTNYEWRTGKIERGDVRIVVTATGTVNADTTVQVGTQVSGIIAKIMVDFNSNVKKGQIIAVLDTTYLASAVQDAKSVLYRAQVQVDLSKRNYDRNKELFDGKVLAQADYDQSLSDYETAKANLVSARSALDRSIINMHYATIVAPISGVVISRNVDVGQTVAASFSTPTLFAIANDLTKMQVQASIDEADIGKIQVGEDVTFTVEAYTDQVFNGKVRQVRLQPTVLQNVVNYTVIIDVPNPDLKLMPGMTANLTVKIQEVLNVFKVAASALRFWPPQDYLDKHMQEIPDSIKQMIDRMLKFRDKFSKQGSGQLSQGMPSNVGGQGSSQGFGGGGLSGGGSRGGSQGGFQQGGGQGGSGQDTGQKSGHQGMRGRMNTAIVWVKEGNKLTPIRVKTGLSDGSSTEITGKLIEGAEVVTGIVNLTNQNNTSAQQQSPFMPQMGRPQTRGGR
jgi:HlyD family secretion protein